jgi:hypothetical protein
MCPIDLPVASNTYDEAEFTSLRKTMHKQELVHLHRLLVEITQSFADGGAVPDEVWNEYEALHTNAYSVHAPKGQHEEAVLLLANTLGEELAQPTEEQSVMSAQ